MIVFTSDNIAQCCIGQAIISLISTRKGFCGKDRAIFADVVGVSLLSECTFRFRRKVGARWKRSYLRLAPRSDYLLRGPSRTEWEHSIPAAERLRYSLTFRNFWSESQIA
jgi:hypothetical protein